jgi:ketosteroid isomerase-like protein
VKGRPAGSQAMDTWEADIRALEEEARLAFLNADLNTLDRLWAEAYVVNSPLQQVLRKANVLELLKTGRIRHQAFDVEIEHLSRHGDLVVVMGRDSVIDPPDGIRSRRRFTNVWTRSSDGTWRAVARHAHVVVREPAA